ncbi:MAG: hypothetical protein E7394_08385 [Ruminococcaceae bacterium]|nr:hypothetical protein [Oscillospiraceae bacterium]
MKKSLKTIILAILILSVGFTGGYFVSKRTDDEKAQNETVDIGEPGKKKTDDKEKSGKESKNNDYEEGTLFVYQASTDESSPPSKEEEIEAAVSIMRMRLDAQGLNEATVNARKEKEKALIEVWIPKILGQKRIEKMSDYLSKAGNLSFRDASGKELINGTHISGVTPIMNQDGNIVVQLMFTQEGQKLFAEATAANVGRHIAIYVDNALISNPNVNEAINSDTCIIEGGFDDESAKMLASQLNSGIYPCNIDLVSVDQISE